MNLSFEIPISNRLEGLDQLRGIAVLCVLLSHFSIAINNGLIDIQNKTINVGTIGVLIFSVLADMSSLGPCALRKG